MKINLSASIKNTSLVVCLFALLISCNSKMGSVDYEGTWAEVKLSGEEYKFIDCGDGNEIIKVTGDSVYHKGIMEDVNFKAVRIQADKTFTTFFSGKNKQNFYRFSWADKQKGIAKWEVGSGSAVAVKYFVNQANLKDIKTVKGAAADCMVSGHVGDVVNDSYAIANGQRILYIEDGNCVTIRNKQKEQLYERCFDGMTVHIRPDKGDYLPLTFISGSKSMDVNFYESGADWVSKYVDYYSGEPNRAVKITVPINISIKKFDFAKIAENASKQDQKGAPVLADLQNPTKLKELDIYQIATILKATPVTQANLQVYDNASKELNKAGQYNEARIILLELVNAAPEKIHFWLELGNAQWGFDDKVEAKKSYQKYLDLMQTQDKANIPQYVYERLNNKMSV